MTNSKQVLIHGPLYCHSGYSVHARQIARILYNHKDFECTARATIWGNTPFQLGEFEEKVMLDEMNTRNSLNIQKYDLSVQVILPDEFKTDVAEYNIGVSAVVETDKCNPQWIDVVNKMNLMIVPSNHIKNTLTNSGNVTAPLYVVPECFPSYLEDKDLQCDLDLDFETDFNFLHIGQLGSRNEEEDRKGVLTLIKLFCKTFQDNKDVGLVIKTNSSRNTTIDRRITRDTLSECISKYRQEKYPKIYLIHGPMSQLDMCKLYKHPKVKAFVSFTRGEGFGLPLLEAAAAGLPIIATNWSSYLDFLNLVEKSFIKVNYSLKEIPRTDDRILIRGAKWAYIDEEDAVKKMKKLYESYSVPKQWASSLQSKILQNYNFASIEKQFNEVLNKHYK